MIGRRHVDYVPMVPDDRLVLPDCFVGIEMELEGDTNSEAMDDYNHAQHRVAAKTDGSLRNGGIELVFDEPLMGQHAVAALKYMFKVKEDYSLVGSTRTSTHMHINFSSSKDTGETLVNTVVVWLLLEKAMCLTAGSHREYNSFCVPTYMMNPREENTVYALAAVDYNDASALNNRINALSEVDRYAALNLSSLFKYGTLECRLLGTADYQQTFDWLNILLSIKKAATQYSRDSLLSYASLRSFLTEVMPNVADLLIVNSQAEHNYDAARSAIIAQLGTPEQGVKKMTMADIIAANSEQLFYHTPDMYPDPVPSNDVDVNQMADDLGAFEAMHTLVFDDQHWQSNAVLGADSAGWTGPDIVLTTWQGRTFHERISSLSRAWITRRQGDETVDSPVGQFLDLCNTVGATVPLRRNAVCFAMRFYNLIVRFDLQRVLIEAAPEHVAL
jgi:hypothetical protein